MPKHGSVLLYVHRNRKAHKDGEPRTATSTFTQFLNSVPQSLVEFMYIVFTRMPGESYRRRLMSLLQYLCYVFRALISSLVNRFFSEEETLCF